MIQDGKYKLLFITNPETGDGDEYAKLEIRDGKLTQVTGEHAELLQNDPTRLERLLQTGYYELEPLA